MLSCAMLCCAATTVCLLCPQKRPCKPSAHNLSFSTTLVYSFFNTVAVQLWGSAQQKGVEALATLDEKLEKTPLLEELDPNELPDEVTDRNGKITQDCAEVTASDAALVAAKTPVQPSISHA